MKNSSKAVVLKHGIVSKNIGEKGSYWPSVARHSNGKIAAVWSGGRLGHVCPFGRVDLSFYDEEKDAWTPAAPVFDSPLDDRDAGIVDWNGKTVLTTFNNKREFQKGAHSLGSEPKKLAIAMAYLDSVTDEEEEKYYGSLLLVSEDGENFANFVKMPVTAPHGPTVLKDGRLFYAGRLFDQTQEYEGKTLKDGIYATWTKDGDSWSEPIAFPVGKAMKDSHWFCEPHAAECDDGSILVVIRAHRNDDYAMSLAISRSTDGGKTFSEIEPIGFSASEPWRGEGPGHLLRLSDGRMLLSYGYRSLPYGIRARISVDRGHTWGTEIVLRDDFIHWDSGYPASVELENGNILTVYYVKPEEGKVGRIEYTIWSVPEK